MRNIILKFIFSFLLRSFLKIIVGVKFDNTKFLLSEEQFIIVANHNSHLDTMTIMASLPSKILHKVKPVAAADHFGKTKLKEKLSNYFINTLLIPRKRDLNNSENDPINKMIKALDQGYSLIIFPEGTRGKPEIQKPLQPGIGYILSKRPTIKYIPVFMKGMGKAMPKDDNLIIPFNSSISFGQPKTIENNNILDIVHEVENNINQLRDKI